MEWVEAELSRWRQKSKNKYLKHIDSKDNQLNFTLNGDLFSIKYPIGYPKEKGTLWVEPSSSIQWLSNVNEYSLEKMPRLSRLLKKIEKTYNIHKEMETFEEEESIINSFDMKSNMLREELKKKLPTMKQVIGQTRGKTFSLYKGNEPGKILIEEFMKILQKYKNKNIQIETVDKNIYHWSIKFSHFENKRLMKELEQLNAKYRYDYIQIEIMFYDKLYPMHPPIVKIIRPHLKNGLIYKISSLRMIQLEYWNPTRGMVYVIDKIYKILNKHAFINVETERNDKRVYDYGAYYQVEQTLLELSHLTGLLDSSDLDTTAYSKLEFGNKKSNMGSKNHWKSGTGYGHSGLSSWNIEDYVRLQKEKDEKISNLLIKICEVLNGDPPENIKDIIQGSCLIPYIITQLSGFTFLDAEKHESIYKNILQIIQSIALEDTIELFDIKVNGNTIYGLLEGLMQKSDHITDLIKDNFLVPIIRNLFSMIKPVFNQYQEKQKKIKKHEEKKEEHVTNNYSRELKSEKFGSSDLLKSRFYFNPESNSISKSTIKRIGLEYASLMDSLPVDYAASIFFRSDKNNLRVCRALITGPHETPYENGCYIFDILMSKNYPQVHPKVWFINHGGVRFNPNLYDSGKVCLSLIGTWNAEAGETWNPKTSTLYQVLLSIQSLILIEQPYFNEPSYEKSIGTVGGKQKSKDYNNKIRLYTMRYSILDLLKNPSKYPEFEQVFLKHFRLKKDMILKTCQKWVNEATSMKSDYKKTFEEIKKHIN